MAWKAKSLSWAGRSTLIQFVLNSLPLYTLVAFKLPKKICNKIDKLNRRFWYGKTDREGSFHSLISWDMVCQPKGSGGLGFRKAQDLNNSMISKIAWTLSTEQGILAGKIFNAKYGNMLQ